MDKEKLLSLIKEKGLEEVLSSTDDEEILYSCSLERGNVFSCIDFSKEDTVLEYSSNCYTATLYYLPLVSSVTKITFDFDIDEAIYQGKVKLISETDDTKYSKIILNDVLDSLSQEEAIELLKDTKEHLLENGQIILTLTNKYSIQLLSGKKDISSDSYFSSLTGENLFTKKELIHLFESLSLDYQFYYPLPDYYFTQEIYSDDYLPSLDSIHGIKDSYQGKRYVLFDDDVALNQRLKDGDFDLFTPSYLVILKVK